MGEFYYSNIGKKISPDDIHDKIISINENKFKEKYIVKLSEGIPVTKEDNRIKRWEFWLPDWNTDCAFTMSLLNDGRMEFKVPRSKWDEYWEDQQMIRRTLVKSINENHNTE